MRESRNIAKRNDNANYHYKKLIIIKERKKKEDNLLRIGKNDENEKKNTHAYTHIHIHIYRKKKKKKKSCRRLKTYLIRNLTLFAFLITSDYRLVFDKKIFPSSEKMSTREERTPKDFLSPCRFDLFTRRTKKTIC